MTGAQPEIAAAEAAAAAAQAAQDAADAADAHPIVPAPAAPVPAGTAGAIDPSALIALKPSDLYAVNQQLLERAMAEKDKKDNVDKTTLRDMQGKLLVLEAENSVSLARSRGAGLPKNVVAHYLFCCDTLVEVKRMKAQLQAPDVDVKEVLVSAGRLERVVGARMASYLVAASSAGGDAGRVNWPLGETYYTEANAKAKLQDGVWSEVDFTEPNSKIIKHVKETYGPGDTGASSSRPNTTTPAKNNPPPRHQEQRSRSYNREGDSSRSKWPRRN